MQTQYWAARDYLAPVLKESKFREHGRITPGPSNPASRRLTRADEFVAAGDFLVYKFGLWQCGPVWLRTSLSVTGSAADSKAKRRDYLPEDKQFLVSRNVPCLRRAQQLGKDAADDVEAMVPDEGEGDEWVAPQSSSHREGRMTGSASTPSIGDIPDVDAPSSSLAALDLDAPAESGDAPPPEMDDIPDMDDDDVGGSGVVEADDPAALPAAPVANLASSSDNLLSVRTYDCYITYDKCVRSARRW